MTSSIGTAYYKIFLHFQSLLSSPTLTDHERARINDSLYVIQTALLEGLPVTLQESARNNLSDIMYEYMRRNLDPIEVGEELMGSLMKRKFRDAHLSKNRSQIFAGMNMDVTHELYHMKGNAMYLKRIETFSQS